MSARDTALAVLTACRRSGAWSDGALRNRIRADSLDRRDAALAMQLCCGVLQNRLLLEHWIGRFAKGKQQPIVSDILQLAVYQLACLDKIPAQAAVNEAVGQAKRHANARAAGFVNAVLRNMLRDPDAFRQPEDLSLRYSHPEPMVRLLRDAVGDERLEPLLAANNRIPPVYAQLNTLRTDAPSAAQLLAEDGLTAEPHPWLADCLTVRGGELDRSAAFRQGLLYVQDPAARLAVLAAAPKEGDTVLDCCAAPGGKSFAAAIAMKDHGEIVSCDVYPHKIKLIEQGKDRLQLRCIRPMLQDATVLREDWLGHFDVVLADVPCSGLGVIRKKPEIRYKPLPTLEAFPEIQRKILGMQATYVKPGGVLLYSTCTLLRRENEDVVSTFLREHGEFSPEAFTLPNGVEAKRNFCTLTPCDHDTDGFFICKLRRQR